MSGMGDLYIGEYPVDMTVAEARAELADREQKARMTAPESVAEAREVDLWAKLGSISLSGTPAWDAIKIIRGMGYTPGTSVPTAAHYAALKEAAEALRALVTAVTFADPPKLFNGVICHEARVPVEFIDNARAALEQSK